MSPRKLCERILVSVVFLFVIVRGVSGGAYFSPSDREAAKKTLSSALSQPVALQTTYYAVAATKRLDMKIDDSDKKKLCEFTKGAIKVYDAESIFYFASISEALSCGHSADDKVKAALKSALDSDTLNDLYYGVSASLLLKKKLDISEKDLKATIDKILDLEENGLFKRAPEDTKISLLYTGLALDVLAQLSSLKFNQDEKDKVKAVLENADSIISLAEETDSALEFTDDVTKASSLRVTSTIFRAINALAVALDKKVDAIKQDTVSGVANTFLKYKESSAVEDIYFVLEGLSVAASNSFFVPLVLTLSQQSISVASKGTEGHVKVKLTNVFGEFATPAKLYVVKAYPENDESKVLLSNQEVFPVEGDKTSYQFNFLGVKPDPGFYTLEFRATPTEKSKFIPIESEELKLKVMGSISVADATFVVSDSQDAHDIAEARKYKIEFGKSIEEIVAVEHYQFLNLDFKIKSQNTGKLILVHQALVRISNADNEAFFVAKNTGKSYSVKIGVKKLGEHFYNQAGRYSMELIVGDAFVQNPISWKVADLNLNYPNSSRVSPPQSPFSVLPEIQHQFRAPEKRPPKTISMAFTGAVLAPVLVLLIGLLRVGANLGNFPSGPGALFALGFQATLGLILALYAAYWLKLNMMQTLTYLGILSVPFLFFSHKNLNELASKTKSD